MSITSDFAQFNEKQVDDVKEIIEFSGKYADLYRISIVENPGFDNEVGNEELIEKIRVHIAKINGPKNVKDKSGIEVSKTRYVALSNYTDIMVGDKLKIGVDIYKVFNIDKSNIGKIEMNLEKIE